MYPSPHDSSLQQVVSHTYTLKLNWSRISILCVYIYIYIYKRINSKSSHILFSPLIMYPSKSSWFSLKMKESILILDYWTQKHKYKDETQTLNKVSLRLEKNFSYISFLDVNFENLIVKFHVPYVLNMHIKFRTN